MRCRYGLQHHTQRNGSGSGALLLGRSERTAGEGDRLDRTCDRCGGPLRSLLSSRIDLAKASGETCAALPARRGGLSDCWNWLLRTRRLSPWPQSVGLQQEIFWLMMGYVATAKR